MNHLLDYVEGICAAILAVCLFILIVDLIVSYGPDDREI